MLVILATLIASLAISLRKQGQLDLAKSELEVILQEFADVLAEQALDASFSGNADSAERAILKAEKAKAEKTE